MPYDYSKLDGKIVEVFKNRQNFAKSLGLSERSLSLKMNGKVPWKQPEIAKICNLLSITENEIGVYFFALKVQ